MKSKLIVVLMSFVLLLSLFSSSTLAAADSSKINSNVDFTKLSPGEYESYASDYESLIEEVDPYVVLDPKTKKFKLNEEAKNALDKETIQIANKIINKTNNDGESQPNDLKVTADGKSLEYVAESQKSDQIAVAAASAVKIKISKKWYGYYIHLNHAAVQAFQRNLTLYGAGTAGVNLALQGVFALAGMSPPGWMGALVAFVASAGAYTVIKADKGCGTNIRLVTTPLPGGIVPVITNAC